MKIVQFLASGGVGFGGAEKVFVELSNALAERHQVTVLVVRKCPFVERFSQHVEVIELRSNPTINNPVLHYEIYQRLRSLHPDVIHTHAVKATELVKRVNRFIGLNHLGTKHNDRKGRVFNRLDWVTTISAKARESIIPKSGGSVKVVYNGVIEEPVSVRCQSDTFTMIAIGRLEKIKGFDVLIEQVAQLNFPYRLLIVGEGPEKKSLEKLIVKLGLDSKINLLGFREDIAQMMHNSHLVLISSHKEGGPRVMIEALLYAPALISTPVGMVPEVLPEEFRATQYELGKKISHLYRNYEHYTKRFESVRKEKKGDFQFQRIVEQYEDVYQQLADS